MPTAVDRGETKRFFATTLTPGGQPVDPSTAPTIVLDRPTMSDVNANMTNDPSAVGSWFWDWDTDTEADVDGKYIIRVRSVVGTFISVDRFSAYLYATDIVDDVIADIGLDYFAYEQESHEAFRGFVAEMVYRAYRTVEAMDGFTFSWTDQNHYDLVLCRAKLRMLNTLRSMLLAGSISQDFRIGSFEVNSQNRSSGRTAAEIVNSAINAITPECRNLAAKITGANIPYGRAIFVPFTTRTQVGDPWWQHYQGPAQP